MRTKKIGALTAFVLGLVLIMISAYGKHRLEQAEGTLHHGESFFGGNRAAKSVGGALEGKLAQYRTPLMICKISGFILLIGGATLLFLSRKKK